MQTIYVTPRGRSDENLHRAIIMREFERQAVTLPAMPAGYVTRRPVPRDVPPAWMIGGRG